MHSICTTLKVHQYCAQQALASENTDEVSCHASHAMATRPTIAGLLVHVDHVCTLWHDSCSSELSQLLLLRNSVYRVYSCILGNTKYRKVSGICAHESPNEGRKRTPLMSHLMSSLRMGKHYIHVGN